MCPAFVCVAPCVACLADLADFANLMRRGQWWKGAGLGVRGGNIEVSGHLLPLSGQFREWSGQIVSECVFERSRSFSPVFT